MNMYMTEDHIVHISDTKFFQGFESTVGMYFIAYNIHY